MVKYSRPNHGRQFRHSDLLSRRRQNPLGVPEIGTGPATDHVPVVVGPEDAFMWVNGTITPFVTNILQSSQTYPG